MTLFKKVFSSHAMGEPRHVPLAETAEPDDIEIDFDDTIARRVAELTEAEAEPAPTVDQEEAELPPRAPDTIKSEPPAKPDPAVVEVARAPAPTAPEPTQVATPVQPSMAERAAAAQREIEQSRLRMATDRPRPAPEAVARTVQPEDPAPPPDAADTQPEPPRPGRSARRVRTRLLGFDQSAEPAADPFTKSAAVAPVPTQKFPTGWFVVTDGPGRGHSFAIFGGVSTIGRGEDQSITLDFGDNSISREKHAAVAFDEESGKFFLGHGGKSNIVRLNDRPVLSTEDLSHGDVIRIGETTLQFVAFCGADFNWGQISNEDT